MSATDWKTPSKVDQDGFKAEVILNAKLHWDQSHPTSPVFLEKNLKCFQSTKGATSLQSTFSPQRRTFLDNKSRWLDFCVSKWLLSNSNGNIYFLNYFLKIINELIKTHISSYWFDFGLYCNSKAMFIWIWILFPDCKYFQPNRAFIKHWIPRVNNHKTRKLQRTFTFSIKYILALELFQKLVVEFNWHCIGQKCPYTV